MTQIEALMIAVVIGGVVGVFFPELKIVRKLLVSSKARSEAGVALGIFIALNLGPLMTVDPWLNRSEEEVSQMEILVVSAFFCGFFVLLAIRAERKERKEKAP